MKAGFESFFCPLKWSVASAVNNEEILKRCLLSSPEVCQASAVMLQKGYASAAVAYNAALETADTDIVVFAHQDMFLPQGWLAQLQEALTWLSKMDPHWGVLGVWGVKRSGEFAGHIYCAGLKMVGGAPFLGCVEVRSLDEVILIVRRSSGLRFDEALQDFHMYGTDICLEAAQRGLNCYVMSAFCIHNTTPRAWLPWSFWKACLVLRRKWKRQLPIRTPCTEVTRYGWPILRWNLARAINLFTGRDPQPARGAIDPVLLHRELAASGKILGAAYGRAVQPTFKRSGRNADPYQ